MTPHKTAAAIALIVFSIGIAVAAIVYKAPIDALLFRAGPAAYPLAVAVFAIVTAAPFSVTDALAISNGVLFGPVAGSLVNAAGIVLGALLGYYVARRTAKLLDIAPELHQLPAAVRHFRVGSPLFLIVLRIIPGVGGTLATQLAAVLRVPIMRHLTTFCIVTVPFCTLLAFGGTFISVHLRHLLGH